MKTVKLYQRDVYQRECDAVLQEVITDPEALKTLGLSKKKPVFAVIPDVSVFFPTGGGQSCDLGTMLVDNSVDYPVIDVFEKEDAVYHVIDAEACSGDPQDLKGVTVRLKIDWDLRFTNMQRHCGEHILSGAFDRLFGGVNRGFHMGEDYMTVDISLEKDPACDHLTWEMAMQAESFANQVIWKDAPVTVRYFKTREEADALPLRKPLTIDEDISIVCVGDPNQPSDCVACCGTHPSTAGQVGIIKIMKLENYKGMTRIYMEAGRRAFEDYRKKHDIVTELGSQYSTEAEKLLDSVEKQNRRNQEIRQELAEFKRALTESCQEEIEAFYANWPVGQVKQAKEEKLAKELPSSADQLPVSADQLADLFRSEALFRLNKANSPIPMVCKSFNHLKVDDVQTLGRKVTPSIRGLLILISQKDQTAVLFSGGSPDCGKLVRENASICQGKGGGNGTCARAIFPSDEAIRNYVDLLEKHLR